MPSMSTSHSGVCLRRYLLIALIALISPSPNISALPQTFDAGALIIPMDTDAQDHGMLRAYGLVYALLRNGVPVHWTVEPGKSAGGSDFAVSGGLENVKNGATVATPRSYRGGPFVVASADAAAALPVVEAWQASPGDTTVVHRLTTGSFTAEVARTLRRAPRMAVLGGGNEQIAFNNLNAAGIPDSAGNVWSSASPDLLSESQVTAGALFDGTGATRYCQVYSSHHQSTSSTPGVTAELRAWLDYGPLTHAFLQCRSALEFENGTSGRFLTHPGIEDDGGAPTSVAFSGPSEPASQIDGLFQADSGVLDSLGNVGGVGPHWKFGVRTLINQSGQPITERIVLLHGRMDGDPANGQLTYLTGHDYSTALPISSNPQTNGVRLFLNALFAADCAADVGQADVDLSLSAPAATNGSQITYEIDYANPGPRVVENVTVRHELPPGASFVSASAGGTHASGIVTWSIASLAPLAGGTLAVTVAVVSDGSYVSTASMDFAHLTVRRIRSNTVTTVRDTVQPLVQITGGPSGDTSDTTPTFDFTVDGVAAAAACRIDGDPFAPCTSPFTVASPLSPGPHTFEVSATDEAGNSGSDSRAFNVTAASVSFTGFFNPVDNPPVTNAVKAGRTVPLSWRLTDGNGYPVTTLTSVAVTTTPVTCGLGSGTDPVPEEAAGASGLQNLGDGYYRFNWKTQRVYANTCRALTLDLGESMGGEHVLLFEFVK